VTQATDADHAGAIGRLDIEPDDSIEDCGAAAEAGSGLSGIQAER
jgi:hypothetical protein